MKKIFKYIIILAVIGWALEFFGLLEDEKKTETKVEKTETINHKGREAFALRWQDEGYTKGYWPEGTDSVSFWILIKSPPEDADLYAEVACTIAESEYKIKNFSITIWDFNQKKYGKARCY